MSLIFCINCACNRRKGLAVCVGSVNQYTAASTSGNKRVYVCGCNNKSNITFINYVPTIESHFSQMNIYLCDIYSKRNFVTLFQYKRLLSLFNYNITLPTPANQPRLIISQVGLDGSNQSFASHVLFFYLPWQYTSPSKRSYMTSSF